MTDDLLVVEGLSVTYPAARGAVRAVTDVSFTVAPGEVYGLVGASGCGKSSVIAAIAGLLPTGATTSARQLTLGPVDLAALGPRGWQRVRGTRIGLVPQQPMTALTPTVAVGRQLDWYLGPGAVERYHEALLRLGLDAVVERPHDLPARFSGGQLQRLLIAVNTLGGVPDLLLADEPTSTLDATVQAAILDHLAALTAERGLATVLVSHDLAVVARLAHRVGVVHDGRLVEQGLVDELFDRPTHPVTRTLVAAVPRRSAPAAHRPPVGSPSSAGPPTVLEVDRLHHYHSRGPATRRRRRAGVPLVVRAVDDVSLTVAEGEVLAVVGESGSGKSTLARAIAGAFVPTGGTIRLDGRDVTAARDLADRRLVQLVGQNPRGALNRRRRVGHALEQAQRVHGIGTDAHARRRSAARVLDLVHLPGHVLDHRPGELSGGELARVVLARALLVEPRLLLLDESTTSLDAPVKAAVVAVLAEITASLNVATVVITHELSTARTLADRVVVLRAGQVVESGPVSQVLGAPTHDHTRDLVASELVLA